MQRKQIALELSKMGYKTTRKHISKSNPLSHDNMHRIFLSICSDLNIFHNFNNVMPEKFYTKFFSQFCEVGQVNKLVAEKIIYELSIPIFEKKKKRLDKKHMGKVIDYENRIVIGGLPSSKFYSSTEWRSLRYSILEKYGNTCQACGSSPRNGKVIHVDHIKPRSIYPEFALDADNLQILCEDCNLGKMNRFEKDWRES